MKNSTVLLQQWCRNLNCSQPLLCSILSPLHEPLLCHCFFNVSLQKAPVFGSLACRLISIEIVVDDGRVEQLGHSIIQWILVNDARHRRMGFGVFMERFGGTRNVQPCSRLLILFRLIYTRHTNTCVSWKITVSKLKLQCFSVPR